jgi:hypothetical protein
VCKRRHSLELKFEGSVEAFWLDKLEEGILGRGKSMCKEKLQMYLGIPQVV